MASPQHVLGATGGLITGLETRAASRQRHRGVEDGPRPQDVRQIPQPLSAGLDVLAQPDYPPLSAAATRHHSAHSGETAPTSCASRAVPDRSAQKHFGYPYSSHRVRAALGQGIIGKQPKSLRPAVSCCLSLYQGVPLEGTPEGTPVQWSGTLDPYGWRVVDLSGTPTASTAFVPYWPAPCGGLTPTGADGYYTEIHRNVQDALLRARIVFVGVSARLFSGHRPSHLQNIQTCP